MQFLDAAIIKTLCYSDIFDFPLKEEEICLRFIADKKTSAQSIKRRLSLLTQSGKIVKTGIYFHLPNRDSIVKKREDRYRNSRQKLKTAIQIAQRLSAVPYVQAVFLTGATAVDNATRQDDIDILIVSAAGSLWTCRFLVILWLEIQGLRRRPHAKFNAGKICLNLLLTTDSLSVPTRMRSLYTAYEVIQAKPLYDPQNYWGKFQNENAWIHDYLPNVSLPGISREMTNKGNQVFHLIEIVARQLQRIYMWPKRTRETITPDAAYFHPRNTKQIVLAKLAKNLKQYT